NSVISGTKATADLIGNQLSSQLKAGKNQVLALDGYIGAQWAQTCNLVGQHLKRKGINVSVIDFSQVFKSTSVLDKALAPYLVEDREKDPVLLFGKLFKKGYEELLDASKLQALAERLEKTRSQNTNEVILVYGNGCTISALRQYYDIVCYFDVTPKETILRAKEGCFANLGDKIAKPIKALLRQCYYVDFEVAGHLRWDLINRNAIDFYVISDDPS